MKTLRAPFPWFGGKSRASDLIWSRLGDVPNYVEPFAGSLAVLLGRPHAARLETVNDLDCYVANFWRAIAADPGLVAHHADWPVNEADLHARHRWLIKTGAERIEQIKTDPTAYDAQVAGWWVWGQCAWIGSGWCAVYDKKLPRLGRGTGINAQQVPVLNGHGKGIHQMDLPVEPKTWQQRPHCSNAGAGIHAIGVEPWRKRPACANGGRGVHAPSNKEGLTEWFEVIAERLRSTRVCCGDWSRVVTPAVTEQNGLTGVLLDPPYDQGMRNRRCYATDATGISEVVRQWAIENGDNPLLRVALCGYEGEHAMPRSWSCEAWKASGGYGNQQEEGRGRSNAQLERIWFSPHCLQLGLFSDWEEHAA